MAAGSNRWPDRQDSDADIERNRLRARRLRGRKARLPCARCGAASTFAAAVDMLIYEGGVASRRRRIVRPHVRLRRTRPTWRPAGRLGIGSVLCSGGRQWRSRERHSSGSTRRSCAMRWPWLTTGGRGSVPRRVRRDGGEHATPRRTAGGEGPPTALLLCSRTDGTWPVQADHLPRSFLRACRVLAHSARAERSDQDEPARCDNAGTAAAGRGVDGRLDARPGARGDAQPGAGTDGGSRDGPRVPPAVFETPD